MIILDYIIIGLILIYFLNGLYRGFLPSLLNMGGFFLSWIISFLTYPLLSRSLVNSDFFSSFRFYIEGAERINNYEIVNLNVSQISETQLTSIMQNAKMPIPYDSAIVQNIKTQAFADQGLTTLGEYFDATIYNVIINIIALLIIFICLRVLFTLLTNAVSYSMNLPQLRHFDYLLGGGVSLIRGFFSMHLVFMIIPIALILIPVSAVTDMLNSSVMSSVFYSGSIALRFISGSI